MVLTYTISGNIETTGEFIEHDFVKKSDYDRAFLDYRDKVRDMEELNEALKGQVSALIKMLEISQRAYEEQRNLNAELNDHILEIGERDE